MRFRATPSSQLLAMTETSFYPLTTTTAMKRQAKMLAVTSAPWHSRATKGRHTAAALFILLIIVESFYYLRSNPYSLSRNSDDVYGKHVAKEPLPLPLPPIYSKPHYISDKCQRRYGLRYIEDMIETNRPYCETANSKSQISCFQNTVLDGRKDLFCTATNVVMPSNSEKYEIDCRLRDWNNATELQDRPQISEFREEWYQTGPGPIFRNFINIGKEHMAETEQCKKSKQDASHTILIKRELTNNLWHSLLEIFSYTLTMDILSMSRDENGESFYSADQAETSEVFLLDDDEPGPYLDLWNLIAKRPVRRRSDLNSDSTSCITNLIVPLSGATNPMWLGDWLPIECKESKIFDVFIERVIDFYGIRPTRDDASPLVLTFIDRKGTRRLQNQDQMITYLQAAYPNVAINVVDFATLNLKEQIQIVSNTDILAGVHGAGLTHAIWLPKGSAVVEIQPMDVSYKGFRNIAALRGLHYHSAHTIQPPKEEPEEREKKPWYVEDKNWHVRNVYLEKDRFMALMSIAIRSVYHRGILDFGTM
jgi:Glycosyltransferase 61